MPFPIHKDEVPYLTPAQAAEMERFQREEYKAPLYYLVEPAGLGLARLARARFLDGDPRGKPVVVLVGGGLTGAAGLVAARWLFCWGANVHVVLGKHPKALSPAAASILELCERMHLSIDDHESLGRHHAPALIVDAILGPELDGPPKNAASTMIHWANAQIAPTLSLTIPSGIDPRTGHVHDPVVDAKATLAVGLPWEGTRARGVKGHVGELYLADGGLPASFFLEPNLKLEVGPLFATSDLLRLR